MSELEYAVEYVFDEAGSVNATGWVSEEKVTAWLNRRESHSGVDSDLGPWVLKLTSRPKGSTNV